MAILQSTTISGSINDTGSLQITGSTFIPPQIESALTSSFTASGLLWINADNGNLQYTTETSKGTIQSPASFMGAWSAGGLMPANRCRGMQAVGVQNAALAMGGVPDYNGSDEYNGTSWASAPTMTCCGFQFQAAGTQDAALAMGMYPARTQVISYNGSSWTTSTGTPVGVRLGVGGGFQNAAWVYGQFPSTTATLHWNGSSWSSNATIGLAGNQYGGGVGTISAALSSGASGGTYAYDGVVWSQSNPNNSGLNDRAASGQQDAAVYAAGRSPQSQQTEEWNGMSWVRACDIPVASDRGAGLSGGNSSADAGLAVGGYLVCQAYEYTKNDIVPYTTCVWTSGAGNLFNIGDGDGAGSANAALSFGGLITPNRVSCTQEYEGTSWVVGGAMINAGNSLGGNGTMNAALAVGGETRCACTEEYNGSSWSTGGALNAGRYSVNSLGTQNSAIAFGGFAGPSTSQTCAESYNGTSWSTLSAMNCKKHATIAGSGTANASIVYGGTCYTAPTSCQLNVTEEWDGSSWSIAASIINARRAGTGGGDTVNTALAFGGYNPSGIPGGSYYTELYDGVSWSNGANGLEVMKNSSGNAAGQNGAFSTMGNGLVNSPYSSNNKISQFYEAVCSTTMCSALGTWSAAADMINARNTVTTTGTQNATLSAGGSSPLGSCSEEYNGLSWTAGGALINSYFGRAAAGTQDASLAAGAYTPPSFQSATEEYNGSTWSAGGNLSTARWNSTSGGTQNAAYIAGGWQGSMSTATEEYNGSSWSAGGTFPAKYGMFGGSVGTQNSGFAIGGYKYPAPAPNVQQSVQSYDGTSWSSENDILARRDVMPRAGTNAYEVWIGDANSSPQSGGTQLYDGVSWSWGKPTNRPQMKTGAGSQTSALAVTSNGLSPHGFSCGWTEEFTCVTSGACVASGWSIGPDLITGRADFDGAGTRTAGIMVGGRTPTTTGVSEEYNGTSYSSGGSLINARSHVNALGTQNATLASAGSPFPAGSNLSEEYDGTSWSAGGTMITARFNVGSTGVQNAGLATGGQNNAIVTCTEEYDGTSWTSGGALGIALGAIDAVGTQNDAITQGQSTPGTSTQIYDGTSWSAGPNFNVSRNNPRGIGTTTNDVMMAGGRYANSSGNNVEEYNGVAWTNHSALNHNRYAMGAIGSGASSGNVAGGYGTPPGGLNAKSFTEEYQVATQGAGLTYKRNEVTGS